MKMKSTLLILFLLLPLCAVQGQAGPERCIKNHTAPAASSYSWPPDTEVRIYFQRDMFTAEEREVLLATIKAWSAIAEKSGTGVKFTNAGDLDATAACTNCLRVTRAEVNRNHPKYYAFFYPEKLTTDWLLISARIELDFATRRPQALSSFMAHELGHGMGLSDCQTCEKKRTIMNGFPQINRDNGLIGPSNCDVEIVKEIYELRRRPKNNATPEITNAAP